MCQIRIPCRTHTYVLFVAYPVYVRIAVAVYGVSAKGYVSYWRVGRGGRAITRGNRSRYPVTMVSAYALRMNIYESKFDSAATAVAARSAMIYC